MQGGNYKDYKKNILLRIKSTEKDRGGKDLHLSFIKVVPNHPCVSHTHTHTKREMHTRLLDSGGM